VTKNLFLNALRKRFRHAENLKLKWIFRDGDETKLKLLQLR
jgi:hypothetical protein